MSIKSLINTYDNIPENVGEDRALSLKARSKEVENKAFQNLASTAANTVKMLSDAKKARDMVKAQDVLNEARLMQSERMAELSQLPYDQLDERITSGEFKDRNSQLIAKLDKLNPKATAAVRKDLEFRQAKERLQLESIVNRKTAAHTSKLLKDQLQVLSNKTAADPSSMETNVSEATSMFAHLPLDKEQRKDMETQLLSVGYRSKLSGLIADPNNPANLASAKEMLDDKSISAYIRPNERKAALRVINRPDKAKKKTSFANAKYLLKQTADGSFSQFSQTGIKEASGIEGHDVVSALGTLLRSKAVEGKPVTRKETAELFKGFTGKAGIEFKRTFEPGFKTAIQNYNKHMESDPVGVRKQLLEDDLPEGTAAMELSNPQGRALTNDRAEQIGEGLIEASVASDPKVLQDYMAKLDESSGGNAEKLVYEALKYTQAQGSGLNKDAAGIILSMTDHRTNDFFAPQDMKNSLIGLLNGTIKKGNVEVPLSEKAQKHLQSLGVHITEGVNTSASLIAQMRLSAIPVKGGTAKEIRAERKENLEAIIDQIQEEVDERLREPEVNLLSSGVGAATKSFIREHIPYGQSLVDDPAAVTLSGAPLTVGPDDDPEQVGAATSSANARLDDTTNMYDLLKQTTQAGETDLLSEDHRALIDRAHMEAGEGEVDIRYTLEPDKTIGSKDSYNLAITTQVGDSFPVTTILEGPDDTPLSITKDEIVNNPDALLSDEQRGKPTLGDRFFGRGTHKIIPAKPTNLGTPKVVPSEKVFVNKDGFEAPVFKQTMSKSSKDLGTGNAAKLTGIVEDTESPPGTKTSFINTFKKKSGAVSYDVGPFQINASTLERAQEIAAMSKEEQFQIAGKILDDAYGYAKRYLSPQLKGATETEKKVVSTLGSYFIYNAGPSVFGKNVSRRKEVAGKLLHLVRTGEFPKQMCTGHQACTNFQDNFFRKSNRNKVLDLIGSVKAGG